MILRTLLLLILSLFTICCTEKTSDIRLSKIENLSYELPKEAWDSLGAINYDILSDDDKHYYDFLSVKVADKNYITHSSDSLILKVIDFESKHQKYGRYPESLYYGGRVYSDLGDYPTALRYFQDALSITPLESNLNLRGCILSQIGRLLNRLRLYNEAIPYIKESIQIDSIEDDRFNLCYDNQLIGSIYLHTHNTKEAKPYFFKALELATKLSPADRAHILVYLAACNYEENNLSEARSLIKTAMDSVAPIYRNISLSYASDIYLKSNITDSSYMFAFELAHSRDFNNRKCGYQNLLSPELLPFSSQDSILSYIVSYKSILEDYYDKHEAQQALMQQSLYNYQIQERDKNIALKSRKQLISWLLISIFFILIITIIFLSYRIKTNNVIIKLHDTIDKLDAIQHRAANPRQEINTISSSQKLLRERLKQKIDQIDSSTSLETLPPSMTNSKPFKALTNYVEDKKFISDSNPIWMELYDLILQNYPSFEANLYLLMGSHIKQHELQTIILIKCRITPSQMTYLLGKAKGSISSRRESLSVKILGERINQKFIDVVIGSL